MNKNAERERRRHKRVQKPCVVEFQVKQGDVQEKVSGKRGMVIIEDLGVGGVFFNYNKNLEIGSLIDLKIGISSSSSPINCVGKIIRIKEMPNTSNFGIGVELTDISEQEREVINKVIEKS